MTRKANKKTKVSKSKGKGSPLTRQESPELKRGELHLKPASSLPADKQLERLLGVWQQLTEAEKVLLMQMDSVTLKAWCRSQGRDSGCPVSKPTLNEALRRIDENGNCRRWQLSPSEQSFTTERDFRQSFHRSKVHKNVRHLLPKEGHPEVKAPAGLAFRERMKALLRQAEETQKRLERRGAQEIAKWKLKGSLAEEIHREIILEVLCELLSGLESEHSSLYLMLSTFVVKYIRNCFPGTAASVDTTLMMEDLWFLKLEHNKMVLAAVKDKIGSLAAGLEPEDLSAYGPEPLISVPSKAQLSLNPKWVQYRAEHRVGGSKSLAPRLAALTATRAVNEDQLPSLSSVHHLLSAEGALGSKGSPCPQLDSQFSCGVTALEAFNTALKLCENHEFHLKECEAILKSIRDHQEEYRNILMRCMMLPGPLQRPESHTHSVPLPLFAVKFLVEREMKLQAARGLILRIEQLKSVAGSGFSTLDLMKVKIRVAYDMRQEEHSNGEQLATTGGVDSGPQDVLRSIMTPDFDRLLVRTWNIATQPSMPPSNSTDLMEQWQVCRRLAADQHARKRQISEVLEKVQGLQRFLTGLCQLEGREGEELGANVKGVVLEMMLDEFEEHIRPGLTTIQQDEGIYNTLAQLEEYPRQQVQQGALALSFLEEEVCRVSHSNPSLAITHHLVIPIMKRRLEHLATEHEEREAKARQQAQELQQEEGVVVGKAAAKRSCSPGKPGMAVDDEIEADEGDEDFRSCDEHSPPAHAPVSDNKSLNGLEAPDSHVRRMSRARPCAGASNIQLGESSCERDRGPHGTGPLHGRMAHVSSSSSCDRGAAMAEVEGPAGLDVSSSTCSDSDADEIFDALDTLELLRSLEAWETLKA